MSQKFDAKQTKETSVKTKIMGSSKSHLFIILAKVTRCSLQRLRALFKISVDFMIKYFKNIFVFDTVPRRFCHGQKFDILQRP